MKFKIYKLKNPKFHKIFILFTLLSLSSFLNLSYSYFNYNQKELNINNNQNLRISAEAVYYVLNLTNSEINNTQYKHNQSITVKGIVFRPPFPTIPQINVNVSLIFDGYDLGESIGAKNSTDDTGNFTISTRIPMWANVYKSNLINVTVTDNKTTKYNHHYLIDISADSSISYEETNTYPKVNGENYKIAGNLYFDNNSGISGANVDVYWRIDGSDSHQGMMTTDSNGSFFGQFSLPSTGWNSLSLLLNFVGTSRINYSSLLIHNLLVFSNFTCNWDLPEDITESDNVTVRGELSSSSDPSLKIFNRSIAIHFNGLLIKQLTTNSSGGFSFDFIPSGNGTLTVSTNNILNLPVHSSILINMTAASTTTPSVGGLLIDPLFIAILIISITGIIIAVYFFSKRKVSEPKVIQIPLENKLKNITILKDTERLEEAVVYLFYIFLQLSEAKYRIKKDPYETINDYAIKCVKDMGLPPLKIYPFIKKIEKILYGSRGIINEEDFNEIFSQFASLFFDFTGYQIKL